jgi:hypoxanthine phosphoribosyltransferase
VKSLLDAAQLREGVTRLARQISRDYAGRSPTLIGVLTGSLVFLADLMRQIDLPLQIGLVQASSYRGATTRPGELELRLNLLPDVAGQDVLLVDDIFDTGHTLDALIATLRQAGPRSIRSAVLLRKLGRQEVELTPDYVGFEIHDVFVVGYGLDYNNAYRQLPYVAELEDFDRQG